MLVRYSLPANMQCHFTFYLLCACARVLSYALEHNTHASALHTRLATNMHTCCRELPD